VLNLVLTHINRTTYMTSQHVRQSLQVVLCTYCSTERSDKQ